MEPETQPDGERPASSGDNAGMSMDTAEQPNDISAFEELIDSKKLEAAVLSAKGSEREPAQKPNVREIENHFDSEGRGRTLSDHFRELSNHHMAKNFFTLRIILIALGFSMLLLKVETFSLQTLDQFMALVELFSTQMI